MGSFLPRVSLTFEATKLVPFDCIDVMDTSGVDTLYVATDNVKTDGVIMLKKTDENFIGGMAQLQMEGPLSLTDNVTTDSVLC